MVNVMFWDEDATGDVVEDALVVGDHHVIYAYGDGYYNHRRYYGH